MAGMIWYWQGGFLQDFSPSDYPPTDSVSLLSNLFFCGFCEPLGGINLFPITNLRS